MPSKMVLLLFENYVKVITFSMKSDIGYNGVHCYRLYDTHTTQDLKQKGGCIQRQIVDLEHNGMLVVHLDTFSKVTPL